MNNNSYKPVSSGFNRFLLSLKTTRFKATIYHSLLFLSLEVFFGFIVYNSLHDAMRENIDVSLTKQAAAITKIVTSSRIDFEKFVPDSLFDSPEDVIWEMIFDEVAMTRRNSFIQISYNERIIFKTVNLYNRELSFPDKTAEIQIFNYTDTTISNSLIRVVVTNKEKFRIINAFPKEGLTQTLSSLIDIFILLAPAFLILSVAGGYLISRRSLSRIDAIIKRTEDITAQNLNEKIEGEHYNDEYGRLVKKMNEMIHRIQISVEYMNQFSISAAHELRTPLTILRGEIELALRSPKTPEQYLATLQSNYEETLRLIRIVANLFFISKADHSLVAMNREITPAEFFLEQLTSQLAILGKEKEMKLKFFVSPPGLLLNIDKQLITQAISNLVDNAVKYGDQGTEIIISAEQKDERIFLSVTNTGETIPFEELPKVFQRFYRIEQSRNRSAGGAGLGLSVVRVIAECHNGTVEVISFPNSPTVFSLCLPKH